MKKTNWITCLLLFVGTVASAQNSNPWPTSGSVGVGTISPATPLHVHGGSTMGGGWNKTSTLSGDYPVQIFNSAGIKWAGIGYDHSAALRFWLNGSSDNLSTVATMAMSLSNSGNLGVGISTPLSKLHVDGNIRLGSQLDNTIRYVGKGHPSDDITGGNSNWIGFPSTTTQDYLTFGTHMSGVHGGERMRLDALGNLSIGTADSQGHKLAVNGSMIAESVKVKLSANWPDFVFRPDYRLRSLNETEQFIAKNGHLPEIPSAKEVEENGINVGEMNSKLLQKIEELTLHLINQNKEIELLKKQMQGKKDP